MKKRNDRGNKNKSVKQYVQKRDRQKEKIAKRITAHNKNTDIETATAVKVKGINWLNTNSSFLPSPLSFPSTEVYHPKLTVRNKKKKKKISTVISKLRSIHGNGNNYFLQFSWQDSDKLYYVREVVFSISILCYIRLCTFRFTSNFSLISIPSQWLTFGQRSFLSIALVITYPSC